MTQRINSAVKALFADDSLLAMFRKNPDKAMRRFELLDCELDAIKLGDQEALLAHGLDENLITAPVMAPHWFTGLLGTVARRMAAPAVIAVLLALSIHAADISTASAARANVRARQRIGRIRAQGPLGLRRISLRARKRTNIRAVRARVLTRHSYRVGLDTAYAQTCPRCSADGSK
ncbi:MAG: hypothetical protein HQ477_04180 [Chloroflexi bacterium]|nr:hypothetical protein [Chloroflexota bacterium]